jgi:putative ABC transport system permease protein
VIADLDALLARYGGTGAEARKDQLSHAFLDAELEQLYAMARIIRLSSCSSRPFSST